MRVGRAYGHRGQWSGAPQETTTDLHWNVLTSKRPGLTRDLPPGKEELSWVANSSTLIYGERDAILVDTFLTTEQSKTQVDWVVASGKNLTMIYVTHGHGDHFFSLAPLIDRFPHAKAVATPGVAKSMQEYLSSGRVETWRKLFPGQIPDRLLAAEPLDGDELELEGRKLVVVNAGRTDTSPSTCLLVPSTGPQSPGRGDNDRAPALRRHAEDLSQSRESGLALERGQHRQEAATADLTGRSDCLLCRIRIRARASMDPLTTTWCVRASVSQCTRRAETIAPWGTSNRGRWKHE
jgi:glyoxylase-like metal-dependent hydrolase (beta-lactamase superfamily II)